MDFKNDVGNKENWKRAVIYGLNGVGRTVGRFWKIRKRASCYHDNAETHLNDKKLKNRKFSNENNWNPTSWRMHWWWKV